MEEVPGSRLARLPAAYAEFLEDLKGQIRSAQVRAALAVNRELVALYWQLGRTITRRQEEQGWGQKVIDRLGEDLQAAFPGVQGFSRSNIYRMRSFFLAYGGAGELVPQLAGQLTPEGIPQPVAEMPWGHNAVLLEKLQGTEERLWYARKTIEQGWSRAVLVHQIESGLYRRQRQAINNFAATLPAPQSDLAGQLLKDPYNFDFLTLAEDARERELQRGLLEHLRDFLIELGVGFAFVGSRHHLVVGGQDYYLDLLFYHLRLRAFVVIELKVEGFEPEHAEKMNFYLSAVDDLLRHPDDKSSIGLILCRHKNKVVVEYSLRDASKPMGVASYQVVHAGLPAGLRESLPSVERLEEELERAGKCEGEESES
jgi:predicted nuclease of restriction endonuclease-like (RecB) superfamily